MTYKPSVDSCYVTDIAVGYNPSLIVWMDQMPQPRAPKSIPASRVRELLAYDEETGVFTWKVDRNGAVKAGMTAGTLVVHGYIKISVECMQEYAHRLAWLIKTGEWPEYTIDHIDGNKSNNAWSNLRQATHMQNQWNKIYYGTVGTALDKRDGWWNAKIAINGVKVFLGRYKTREEAHAAYAGASIIAHGEFSVHKQ